MYRVVDCITQDHQLWLVIVAGIVCAIGSCLSVLLTRRYVTASGGHKSMRLAMTGLMAGATLWSTHFIAMLAYDPGFDHGYEPVKTALSLVIAVLGTATATAMIGFGAPRRRYVSAGITFGFSIAAMHFLGISAYLLPGRIVWEPDMLAASVLLGIGLSLLSYQRIMYPITRLCWMGGAVLMLLAIFTTHFIGMAALTVELSPLVAVPPMLISDGVLALIILFVTVVILLVGFAAFGIETNTAVQARKETIYAATHDALTGLPNRTKFKDVVRLAADRLAQDPAEHAAILFVDLNLFKEINDLHGHAIGDKVLRILANRLRDLVQDDEMIARTGGDEFVALKSCVAQIDDIRAFAERIQDAIQKPIQVHGISLTVSAAIGIASSLEDGRDMDKLLQDSGLAMYRAKSEDGNICFSDQAMDAKNREEILLVNDLRGAIRNGELELFYQPQNDVATLRLTGFEVLLRWNHATRGLVMPSIFIPIAEKTGLIREIGMWVLQEACLEAALWQQPLSIAVNVAPKQLAAPLFLDCVAAALKDSGLAPDRLELEVTEEGLIEDLDSTLAVMHKLRDMGVRIAMDDFGTGYSSLSMLQAFPFDKIKIDRSFIRDVHINPRRAAILRSTLILGEAFDIPILAEGVETDDELAFINAAGCTAVQGFYFGKPMCHADMRDLLLRGPAQTYLEKNDNPRNAKGISDGAAA